MDAQCVPDGERALIERLGTLVRALIPIEIGEIAEQVAEAGMVLAEGCFTDEEGPLEELLGPIL